jgi:hypothetical protein
MAAGYAELSDRSSVDSRRLSTPDRHNEQVGIDERSWKVGPEPKDGTGFDEGAGGRSARVCVAHFETASLPL